MEMTMSLRLEQTPRTRKPQPGRYGMAYRTIRYWQEQGKQLQRLNGWPRVDPYSLGHCRSAVIRESIASTDPRQLAHTVIRLAAVLDAETLRYVLGGVRTSPKPDICPHCGADEQTGCYCGLR
jgi:hypothetical protein